MVSDSYLELFKKVDDYLDYLQNEQFYSNATYKNYRYTLLHFLNDLIQIYPDVTSWNLLTNEQVRHIIRNFAIKSTEEISSNRTRAYLVSVLKSIYKYFVVSEYEVQNFMLNVKTPKYKSNLPEYLTVEQFEELVELPDNPTPKDYRDVAILELIFATGIRVSELVSLKIQDIDWTNQELRVVGKGNKERVVIFGDIAEEALRHWFKVRYSYTPHVDNIFLNRFGNMMNPRAIQILIQNKGIKKSLPIHITPHKLRHSFATEMLTGGADLRVVQELLGHSSLSATQVYLHLDIEKIKKSYKNSHPLENIDK